MTEPHPCVLGDPTRAELAEVLDRLERLRADLIEKSRPLEPTVAGLPEGARASARNLVHYLALRTHDLLAVQRVLAGYGLSSLGRAEAHVLANLDAVLHLLRCLLGAEHPPDDEPPPVGFDQGERLRWDRAEALFGPRPATREVRIIATAPSAAATDPSLVRDLLSAGMDCLRINCAHDGPPEWLRMIEHLRAASAELGRPCAVLMDLSGPRVRTGPLPPGPRVVKVRPLRDEEGRVLRPARVGLAAGIAFAPGPEPVFPVERLPPRLGPGDRLRFRDARGARRRLLVLEVCEGVAWCALARTAYLRTGTRLRTGAGEATLGELPEVERAIRLTVGDTLTLSRSAEPGRSGCLHAAASVRSARIACLPPEALRNVREGERVWFDDGRLEGVVRATDEEGVHVLITRAGPREKLRAGRGINFPDSELGLPALTADDLRVLPFICDHADLIGHSFASGPEDVRRLREALERQPRRPGGIMLKIETPRAFLQLPGMLLEVLRDPAAGVMIARGDLAVEAGFERLAELQEEILCLCEAAHLPVVWATQVLEQLARRGLPSRAEVSDVALAERAEAVMLNKGPYVADAVRVLADILSRMGRHQEKKRPLLKPLEVARHFFAEPGPARPPGD